MVRSPWRSTLTAVALLLTVVGCSFAGFPPSAFFPPQGSTPPATAAPATATLAPATAVPATSTPTPATATSEPATAVPATATPVPATAPPPPATPTPLSPPPAPTAVTFHQQHTPGSGSPGTTTYTINWSGPQTDGVEIRVSGLKKCLSDVMDEPCIQRHMALPKGTLDLIGRAPASDGSISWTWPTPEILGGALASDGATDYYAFLVGAYDAAGQSRLVIAKSAKACPDCTF
jgi:hypothetical protein